VHGRLVSPAGFKPVCPGFMLGGRFDSFALPPSYIVKEV